MLGYTYPWQLSVSALSHAAEGILRRCNLNNIQKSPVFAKGVLWQLISPNLQYNWTSRLPVSSDVTQARILGRRPTFVPESSDTHSPHILGAIAEIVTNTTAYD